MRTRTCHRKRGSPSGYAKGYLEIREGKHFLAERGKERGAEVRFGKNGIYFLWPKDMLKKFQDRDKTAPV